MSKRMRRFKKNSGLNFESLLRDLLSGRLTVKKIFLTLVAIAALYFGGQEFVSAPTGGLDESASAGGIIQGFVSRVVDGDTAIITTAGNEQRRVRFLGVDTPETVHPKKGEQPYGKAASNFTKESLTGRQVWLEYDASPLDRYNRHLAYIWLAKPERIDEASIRRDMFNAKLLLGGYARVMIIKPNNRYEKLFQKFQSEAQRNKRGLWQ